MEVLLFLICLLAPLILNALNNTEELPDDLVIEKAILPAVAWAIASLVLSVAVGVYSYIQARKMQKKNKREPSQLDGSIADEGVSFSDIAGSPHMYGNIVDKWGETTQAIKAKGGKK